MALNTKISFYISRKNKLTLSPVSSSIIPNILLLSSGKKAERNLKLIAQRLTTRLTRHSLTIIDQGGKRGRGNPKEAERNSNAECIEMTRRNSEQCCSRFVLNRADTRQRSKTRTEAEVNAACVQVCFVRFWIFDKSGIENHRVTRPYFANGKIKMDEDVISSGTLRQFPSFSRPYFSVIHFVVIPYLFLQLLFSRFFVDVSQISVPSSTR